jgi:hypothetical protein
MATGFAPAVAAEITNAIGNNAAPSILPVATPYIQLHTADPGVAGTTAVAGNATRKLVSFGTGTGVMSNDAALEWSTGEVDTSEDYTHWSLWTASTSGTFLLSGTMTANAVTSGDAFTIPVGDLDLTLSTAAGA